MEKLLRVSLVKKLSNKLNGISACFSDIIFPIKCINCGKEGEFICKKCFSLLPKNSFQVCPVCEKTILSNGDVCNHCRQRVSSPINRLFVVSDYKDPLLSKSIHYLKYNFVADLAKPLGTLMIQTMLRLGSSPTPDVIIPIPLHNRRLRWRGFNQSALLANVIAKDLLPGMEIEVLEDVIARKSSTKPQMKIKDYGARQKNIQGCFQIDPTANKKVTAKRILLVDDICTTGSTINECAKELRKLNPKSISAVVLARQS
ncbi:ComF family protein [bacterium]|jgi:ComF family protein|nr:ComF family protein [bacterium]MBT4250731.1 ComF family protein [bacterium]MBT4598186.1 ComF family protein [bacterium]MBT6753784.1 ComF family protein [bacterium]MBT7037503.1 ComF family protein [bacterium]